MWRAVGLYLHTIFGKRVLGGSTTHEEEMMDGDLIIFEEESRSSLVV